MMKRGTPGDLAEARVLFRAMPEQVFRSWLDERIASNGWPPVGRTWEAALRGLSVEDWQRMTWAEEAVLLDPSGLHPSTQTIVRGLLDANLLGIRNAYSEYLGVESFERMKSIATYAAGHGGLPPGLVFIEREGLLDVVDGCHRLAFYFVNGSASPPPLAMRQQEIAWVGRLPGNA